MIKCIYIYIIIINVLKDLVSLNLIVNILAYKSRTTTSAADVMAIIQYRPFPHLAQYIYIYTCVYVCMHTYVRFTCIYIYIYIYICIYIYIYIYDLNSDKGARHPTWRLRRTPRRRAMFLGPVGHQHQDFVIVPEMIRDASSSH